jgi:hypothetical protein
MGEDGLRIPMVPRPPTFILPNRQKGTDRVVMTLGTTSRMTMTLAGSEGTSLEDMLWEGLDQFTCEDSCATVCYSDRRLRLRIEDVRQKLGDDAMFEMRSRVECLDQQHWPFATVYMFHVNVSADSGTNQHMIAPPHKWIDLSRSCSLTNGDARGMSRGVDKDSLPSDVIAPSSGFEFV